MASEVDICNLALAHLGDTATVSSLNPPEGSAQAEHCARFYPIARDTLLELHRWNFSMRRSVPASLTSDWTEWEYAYALPANTMTVLSVLPDDSTDDYSTRFAPADTLLSYAPIVAAGAYTPQAYTIETLADGQLVLYTDQENAVLRYTVRITDTTKFSSLFVMSLSWHLASMLAGPIIKGETGAAEAKRAVQMLGQYLIQAQSEDSNQRSVKPEHIVKWMSGR